MSFKSTAVFSCDGCKVVESDPIEIEADILQARPPRGWLRVQLNKLTTSPRSPDDEALDQLGIKFFCPHCTVSVESYLEGRRIDENAIAAGDDTDTTH